MTKRHRERSPSRNGSRSSSHETRPPQNSSTHPLRRTLPPVTRPSTPTAMPNRLHGAAQTTTSPFVKCLITGRASSPSAFESSGCLGDVLAELFLPIAPPLVLGALRPISANSSAAG